MVVDPMLGMHRRVMNRLALGAPQGSTSGVLAGVGSAYVMVDPVLGVNCRMVDSVLGMHRRVVRGLVVLLLLRIDAKSGDRHSQSSGH